ncbi:hypothetical protein F4802DRAFT_27863 [Xylaria palmicola]|nr:hypothetical protein F4802DRAFT_27863 [Xylaria palmicola]
MSNPWNLAGMVEEKKLKSTFVLATLCSTLINTFSASIGLWDRMSDRRKQKKKDAKQDDEIEKLKEQAAQSQRRPDQKRAIEDSRPPHGNKSYTTYNDDDDDNALARSLEVSEALIRREYNNSVGRLGKRFAVGDLIAENQLQAQVIALQRTVIDVLQQALLNRRSLSRGDVQRLIAASSTARDGSLDALRQQYQRLSFEAHPRQRGLPETEWNPTDMTPGEIYCNYSLALQNTPELPLLVSFAPGGNGCCSTCGVQLDRETAETYWHIEKSAPLDPTKETESQKQYQFNLGQRFIIKCHTQKGE